MLAGAAAAAFAAGWRTDEWRHGAADMKAQARTTALVQAQGRINTAAAATDARVQTQIRYVTPTLTEKVPVYVTAQTDARLPVPVGLVRLHDAAARGLDLPAVPDPAGRPDDAPSRVEVSDLGRAIVGNYGECRADAARLVELQDWIRGQR